MTELYNGKYRVPSARAEWHQYDNGVYFVTICTHEKRHWFGEISDGGMNYSPVGRTAYDNIVAMPSHFPYVDIGAFVVMPNHVHMIIAIDGNKIPRRDVTRHVSSNKETCHVTSLQNGDNETCHVTSLQNGDNETCHVTSLQRAVDVATQSKTWLSVVIGQYKQSVTRQAKLLGIPFAWQTRFHDHIITNQQSYETITQYIENNVESWEIDTMYK